MWVCKSKPWNISFATAMACPSRCMTPSHSFLAGRDLSFLKIKPAFIAASKRFNPQNLRMYIHSPIKVSSEEALPYLSDCFRLEAQEGVNVRSNIGAGMFLSNFDPKVSFSSPIRNLNDWVSDRTSGCRSWPKWLRMLPFIQQSFSLFEKFLRPKYKM